MDEIIDKPAFMSLLYTCLATLNRPEDRAKLLTYVKRFEGCDKAIILRNTR